MTLTIGLSGGIGSGKSTVSGLLQKFGAQVIDADAIVHELQSPGSPMLEEIARVFGPEVIDSGGALDRKALAARVFGDPDLRERLGQIVHPPVIAEMMRQTAEAQGRGEPVVVVDIPLLFEGAKAGKGAASLMRFDATVVVWVSEEVQLERTMARDGCTREEALQRIRAQLSIDQKREMADCVIDNSGSRKQTEAQVRALFNDLVSRQ